jgi:hypothetical protein
VETEFRREAEVVRLTRESNMDLEPTRHPSISATTTTHSSPSLGPVTQDFLGGIPEDDIMADMSAGLARSFKQHAIRNSKGKEFWDNFSDDNGRTPPPGFLHRGSNSGVSDDVSPSISIPPSSLIVPPAGSTSDSQGFSPPRLATPQPIPVPTAAEITRRLNNKRRRDDDFDPSSFKRRAVSPALSVHNSPVMQSPLQRDSWGTRASNSGEAIKTGPNGGPKRVGFQGMVDTNDGLMKMSIE